MKGASFEQKTFKTLSNIGIEVGLSLWAGILRPMTPRHVTKVISGHGRSPAVFSGITFDRDQLEQWKHHRCVQADNMDQLICNMTLLGQVMTLPWGYIFNITFQGQIIYHSTMLDKRSTMLAKEMVYLYWVNSYYRKNHFYRKKRLFFSFCSLEAKPLILDQIWGNIEKKSKRGIEGALAQHCSYSSSRVMRQFVEKCWNRPNLTFGDLWWPDLWPA